ncbi:hypothetical protein SETIT_7G200300v2 [Setaria italica]|uniref:Uncharacterized protein n=1 Tax=Setaria italica TaxID=4555 RepID=A0A368RXS9_SETIT|nr:hypothetical protein SETIT_7G200300v2 [Setaria italica]
MFNGNVVVHFKEGKLEEFGHVKRRAFLRKKNSLGQTNRQLHCRRKNKRLLSFPSLPSADKTENCFVFHQVFMAALSLSCSSSVFLQDNRRADSRLLLPWGLGPGLHLSRARGE